MILGKMFIIKEENDMVCIGWLSYGAQSFKHSCTITYTVVMFFKNKDSLFTLCITRDVQLSKDCWKTFLR
jgi:hypothetical protein